MIELQAKLINSRPRYALGTSSKILKNVNIDEKDILQYKNTNLYTKNPKLSIMNKKIKGKLERNGNIIRAKSTQPKKKRSQDFVDFLFQK